MYFVCVYGKTATERVFIPAGAIENSGDEEEQETRWKPQKLNDGINRSRLCLNLLKYCSTSKAALEHKRDLIRD